MRKKPLYSIVGSQISSSAITDTKTKQIFKEIFSFTKRPFDFETVPTAPNNNSLNRNTRPIKRVPFLVSPRCSGEATLLCKLRTRRKPVQMLPITAGLWEAASQTWPCPDLWTNKGIRNGRPYLPDIGKGSVKSEKVM